MITNIGQKLIAKYLIGQAPAYASYIAIGCGERPVATAGELGDYSATENLKFETYRMPIISRGYIVDNNQAKIVFTAELPSEERYEITEIGVYPAMSNNLAGNSDSRTLFKFGTSETWTVNGSTAIPVINDKIASTISSTTGISNIFRANADNSGLDSIYRIRNYQRPRFLNEKIFIKGGTTDKVVLSGINLDISESSPNDIISFAFSVLNDIEADSSIKRPDSVSIQLKFKDASSKYATATYAATHGSNSIDLSTNRYIVLSKRIADFTADAGFNFKAISEVEILPTIQATSPLTPAKFYVCLDGIRLENVTLKNPLYGLTAYSPIVNVDISGNPVSIVKQSNTSNLIEFRFNVGV